MIEKMMERNEDRQESDSAADGLSKLGDADAINDMLVDSSDDSSDEGCDNEDAAAPRPS